MSERCPRCGELAELVVAVESIGSGELEARSGSVCLDREGAYGGEWVLYGHP